MSQNLEIDFIPENSLEQSLVNVKLKLINLNEFLKKLLEEKIFVLSSSPVEKDGSGLNPLVFDREGVMIISVFTSLSRTNKLANPNTFCLEIQGGNFMARIPEGYGIVLNPGLNTGLEIPPSGVKKICQDFALQF
jgi:hypothetical protein